MVGKVFRQNTDAKPEKYFDEILWPDLETSFVKIHLIRGGQLKLEKYFDEILMRNPKSISTKYFYPVPEIPNLYLVYRRGQYLFCKYL